MEITGFICDVLEKRGGTSARTGNAWALQGFVLETIEQYPRHCAFEVFGEDKLNEFNIKQGEEMTVHFDVDARKYQDRWYNQLRAWKVEKTGRVMSIVASTGTSGTGVVEPSGKAEGTVVKPSGKAEGTGAGKAEVDTSGTGAEAVNNTDLPF